MLRDLPARLLLTLVFGGIALLLAGSVVDNLVERIGESAGQGR